LWLATLVFAVGCGASEPATPLDPASTFEPQDLPYVEPVPEELPAIVARVNDHNLTREELETAVRSAEIQAGQALPPQFRNQVYRSVLDRLVSFHLLVQESETLSILVDDAGVDARIETIRSNFPNEEAFETQLENWETTIEDLREETRRDLLVEGVLESTVLPDIDVDVETTRDFYEQHAAEFTEGGGVQARHILIGISPDADDQEKAEARERANSLRLEVDGGAEFAELARTNSEDPGSAANGGNLGVVVRGQTVPEFEAALFALEPGDVSEVVETAFGFHVIQMIEREAERIVPFTEASIQIREFLLQQEQQARVAAFIEELKTKSDIEILI
jgi:peptidyl-prolyl cis-trans isomerase C